MFMAIAFLLAFVLAGVLFVSMIRNIDAGNAGRQGSLP